MTKDKLEIVGGEKDNVVDFPTPAEKEQRDKMRDEFRSAVETYFLLVDQLSEEKDAELLNDQINLLDSLLNRILDKIKDEREIEFDIPEICKAIALLRSRFNYPGEKRSCIQYLIEQINKYAFSDDLVEINELLVSFLKIIKTRIK